MSVIIDGTDGITTPELDSSGPVAGTTANFSGNVTLGSSVLATPSGSAPSYTCRAWVNFNGTGTVAIRASGNVTSITDNGSGDYTVNFTTAMPDVNYAVTGACGRDASALGAVVPFTAAAVGSRRIQCQFVSGGNSDYEYINVAIFR